METGRGRIAADRVVLATNAYTGDLVPGLKKTFLPIRTPQIVSRPLGDNLGGGILPGGQIMSDTRHPVVGVRRHPDGRLHLGGKIGNSGAERRSHYDVLAAEVKLLFPHLPPLEWEYTWTGWVAMTNDRYPHLHDLAPGLVALLGYSGRGIAMASLMGRELARWASGQTAIETLPLPVSRPQGIPYYQLREILVDGNMLYHRVSERLGHFLSRERRGRAPAEKGTA